MRSEHSTETSETISDNVLNNKSFKNLIEAVVKATAKGNKTELQLLEAMKKKVASSLGDKMTDEMKDSLERLAKQPVYGDPCGKTLKEKISKTIHSTPATLDVLERVILPSLPSGQNWEAFEKRCTGVIKDYKRRQSHIVRLKVKLPHPPQGQSPESSKPEGQHSGSVEKSSQEEPTEAHDEDLGASGGRPVGPDGGKIRTASLTKAVASYETSWEPRLARFKFRGHECQNRCEGMNLLATVQRSIESFICDYNHDFKWAFIGFPFGIEKDGCDLEIMFDGSMGLLDGVPRQGGTNQHGVDGVYSVKSLPIGYTLDQTQWSFVREIGGR